MRTSLFKATLTVGAMALSGCYSYQPIEVADITPEMDIRARVSGAQSDQLADVLNSDDRMVEGTVIENGSDEILLEVSTGTAERRGRVATLNQRVRIPTTEVVAVDRKSVDQTKTTLLVGGAVAAAAVAVIAAITAGSSSSTSGTGPGGPQDILIPLLRLPLGR